MRQIKYILGFVFFTNLFAIATSFWMDLGRPIINLDYALLLFFCVTSRKIISQATLLFAYFFIFGVDLLLMVLQIFPFVRLTDLVYLSSFVFAGPVFYRVLLLISAFVFLISYLVGRDLFLKKIALNLKQFILIIGFMAAMLFINNLINPLEKKAIYTRFDKQWVGSQLLFFIQHQKSSFVESVAGSASKLEPLRFDYSTKPLFTQLEHQQPLSKKILLVVNESWGETTKPEHQMAILDSIYQQKDQLAFIKQGSFHFSGATVAGEIRELCHQQPVTFNLKDINSSEFKHCLPQQLHQLGYQTYAIHGANSMMYDRSSWYPKAGFEEMSFFEQLPDAGLCKSFSGRCDTKLIPYVKKELLASNKSFVYWLTLNTHAPYDDTVFIDDLDCIALKVKESSETCNNYKLQNQFFTALSGLIKDPNMKGVEVYVVGDHSPPIFNFGDNFFSFKGSDVAWVHFKIK